jgi:S1-C subfamily serine protease
VNRTMIAVVAVLALLGCPHPGSTQQAAADSALSHVVQERFAGIAESVVCIRTTAHLPFRGFDPSTGLMVQMESPISMHGSGVVIGSFIENGTREYLILTNDHVVNLSDYFVRQGNFLRRKKPGSTGPSAEREESFVVASAEDEEHGSHVRLELLARNPRGDMALLRTVGADREFAVFADHIGFEEGEVEVGARVITSGFPWGREKIVAQGEILDTEHLHALGGEHVDFRVSIPLEPGQSGSPVFRIVVAEEGGESVVRFQLIGLMHAREGGERFMVPYSLWHETLGKGLASLPAALERR